MKTLPVLAVVAVLAGGAAIIATTHGDRTPINEQSVAAQVRSHLMTLLDLHPVTCKSLQGGMELPGSQCFLSAHKQDVVLEDVQRVLEPVGRTLGWTNDYSVWGAFYTSSRDRQLSFGVNIAMIEGDETLEPLAVTKGYRSAISFIVDGRLTP